MNPFKVFTQGFRPYKKGKQISSADFSRAIQMFQAKNEALKKNLFALELYSRQDAKKDARVLKHLLKGALSQKDVNYIAHEITRQKFTQATRFNPAILQLDKAFSQYAE